MPSIQHARVEKNILIPHASFAKSANCNLIWTMSFAMVRLAAARAYYKFVRADFYTEEPIVPFSELRISSNIKLKHLQQYDTTGISNTV